MYLIIPPPLERWSARLVHRAQAPGQRFLVPARSKIGVSRAFFSGASHRCPMQPYAGWSPRTWPVRCGFAVGFAFDSAVHGEALGVPYAPALLNVFPTPLESGSPPWLGGTGARTIARLDSLAALASVSGNAR